MGVLVGDNRRATVTQISTAYNHFWINRIIEPTDPASLNSTYLSSKVGLMKWLLSIIEEVVMSQSPCLFDVSWVGQVQETTQIRWKPLQPFDSGCRRFFF